MIPVKVKIDPGRCLIQFPHARWYAAVAHLLDFSFGGQPVVGPEPDAWPIRMHLAHAVAAAAAGPIAGVLGATPLGAQKTDMLDGAVAALPAP